MIRLHGSARSRAFRCLWAAGEAGIAVDLVEVKPGAAALRSPDFLRLNPNGKVPALEDGGLLLFESLAINLHLAAKAGAPLMPEGDDRSRTLQWTLWTATEVEPHVLRWAFNAVLRPEAERDPGEAALGAANLQPRLDLLDAQLAGRSFLLGEAFTIGDCNLAGVLYPAWFNQFDLGGHTRVRAWLDRCLERPAAVAARTLREPA